jgi:hypothetical protein
MSRRTIPAMSDTSNLGERKRRFPDPSESDTEEDADFDISDEQKLDDIRRRLDQIQYPVSADPVSDSEDDEIPGDRARPVNQGREPVPKKMKKVTICQECNNKDYGKNIDRHMMTHLPSDSPEKMKWRKHTNDTQGAWATTEYKTNENHRLAKILRSTKRNNEIAKTKNGVEVVALQEFACCKIPGSPSCSCRLDAQSQNDERVSDCMLL